MPIHLSMDKLREAERLDFVLTWIPVSLATTLLLTLFLSAQVSIAAYGESPCGVWLCDISVYGAYPKHGWSEVVFRAGFILIFLQCMLLCGVRCYEKTLPKAMVCYLLTGAALLTMAFVPCYASPVHFYAAGVTFVFLSIGQWVDASYDEVSSSLMKTFRRGMVVSTLGLFGTWFFFECVDGQSYPLLEYTAAVTPFFYFLTWTWETVYRPTGQMIRGLVTTDEVP